MIGRVAVTLDLLNTAVPPATAEFMKVRGERHGLLFFRDVVLSAVVLEGSMPHAGHCTSAR